MWKVIVLNFWKRNKNEKDLKGKKKRRRSSNLDENGEVNWWDERWTHELSYSKFYF